MFTDFKKYRTTGMFCDVYEIYLFILNCSQKNTNSQGGNFEILGHPISGLYHVLMFMSRATCARQC